MTLEINRKIRRLYHKLLQMYIQLQVNFKLLKKRAFTGFDTTTHESFSMLQIKELNLPAEVLSGSKKNNRLPFDSSLDFISRGPFSYALESKNTLKNDELDKSQIVMLVISALRIDPRVEREARVLASAGYNICIICPDISHPSLESQPINWGDRIKFCILDSSAANFTNNSPYLNGNLMLAAALRFKPLAFHCHDLNTAIIGLAASRIVGCKFICDFHEWFSENVSWDISSESWRPHPDEKRDIFRSAEKLVMKQADAVITVCKSIGDELALLNESSCMQVDVIRNIPSRNQTSMAYPSLRSELALAKNQILMLWQGGTGPTRLLEPVIEALKYAPQVTFVIRGPSLDIFGEGYVNLAKNCGVDRRVVLLPPVKSSDVVAAAIGADIGIWTLPNLSKNFYYALPNKIFEYLFAGLPIICANFPEVQRIINKYKIGLTFDPYDPKSIAFALNQISNYNFLMGCKQKIPDALNEMQAEKEWDKLIDLYKKLQL